MKVEGETVTLETIGQETEVAGESWGNQPDGPASPPEADSQTIRTNSLSMEAIRCIIWSPAEEAAVGNSRLLQRHKGCCRQAGTLAAKV